MHWKSLRAQKTLGEDDPALLEEIGKAKLSLEEKIPTRFSTNSRSNGTTGTKL